jgi:uncharacterized protein (DUF433 family)
VTFDKPFDRITVEPEKMGGQPWILATSPDRARLFANYPSLEEKDFAHALAFAAHNPQASAIFGMMGLEV